MHSPTELIIFYFEYNISWDGNGKIQVVATHPPLAYFTSIILHGIGLKDDVPS
jgi:hypothetical protein